MATYHRDVGGGIPADDGIPYGQRVYLNPSNHALSEANSDRYTSAGETLSLPNIVEIRADNVFEVETDDNGYMKVCLREPYDDGRDIIYAVRLDGGVNDPLNRCTLKTVWVNVTDDTHTTLDASAYDSA